MKLLIRFVVGLCAITTICFAHHSFAAEFDQGNVVTIKGTITKFEWMNPHAYFYVDVPDSSGHLVNWAVEGRNLSIMSRMGWTKATLKAGEPWPWTALMLLFPNRCAPAIVSGLLRR